MERPRFHTRTEKRLQTVRNLRARFEQIVETNGKGLYRGRIDLVRGTDAFADTVIHVGEKIERDVEKITSTLLPQLELRYQGLVRERLLELKNAGHISEEEYDEALGVEAHLPETAVISNDPVKPLRKIRKINNAYNGHSPFLPSKLSINGNGAKPVGVEPSTIEAEDVGSTFGIQRHTEFTRDPNKHYHAWKIDEPNGPTSEGICNCGAHRQFKNWLSDSDFTTNEEHRLAV